jgi:hypothetical protein
VVPFTHTFIGSSVSPWFTVKAGSYDVEGRMEPAACAQRVNLEGLNGYPVAELWPRFLPRIAPSEVAQGSIHWAGWTVQLVGGIYRFAAVSRAGCRWTVRMSK